MAGHGHTGSSIGGQYLRLVYASLRLQQLIGWRLIAAAVERNRMPYIQLIALMIPISLLQSDWLLY